MGKLTQLHQGSLSGLRRQTNECLDNAYNKGFEDGKKCLSDSELERIWENKLDKAKADGYDAGYDTGYNNGLKDGNKIADKDLKEIQDSTYDVAYNTALKDTDHAMDVLKGMTETECAEWFEDCEEIGDVVCGFTVQRIVEIIKAYEEKKEAEIKVGDEVITWANDKAVATRVEDNCVRVMFKDGSGFRESHTINELKKTGRHFDEVEQLLNKLMGEE